MNESYIRFRETNNWEKERWRFYIPLRGNEKAIQILADALSKLKPVDGCFVGHHVPYDIRLMPTAGDRVDRLCDAYKGKGGFVDDDLYKGGIAKMMRPWKSRPTTTDWPTGRIRAALMRTPIHVSGYSAQPNRDWADRLPSDIHVGFRRGLTDRCWDARARLYEAGFRTVGDITDLTEKKLLATSGVGRETLNLARWMLQEIGLDFNLPSA